MPDQPDGSADNNLEEVVGLRFEPRGRLRWFRAGVIAASPGDYVVATVESGEAIGRVVVGRGQCAAFPGAVADLPPLSRAARPDEHPQPAITAGQHLLDSLP